MSDAAVGHCCAESYHAEYLCPDTDAVHGGDPLLCPDRLVVRREDRTYGLPIHDGGSSSITIRFRPWCGHSLPVRPGDIQHGSHYDKLVALIEEELGAQIAMGRLGPVDPPTGGIKSVADLIADLVDRVFRLERRSRP